MNDYWWLLDETLRPDGSGALENWGIPLEAGEVFFKRKREDDWLCVEGVVFLQLVR